MQGSGKGCNPLHRTASERQRPEIVVCADAATRSLPKLHRWQKERRASSGLCLRRRRCRFVRLTLTHHLCATFASAIIIVITTHPHAYHRAIKNHPFSIKPGSVSQTPAGNRTARAPASKQRGRDIGSIRRRWEHVQKERQEEEEETRGRDRRWGAVVGRPD